MVNLCDFVCVWLCLSVSMFVFACQCLPVVKRKCHNSNFQVDLCSTKLTDMQVKGHLIQVQRIVTNSPPFQRQEFIWSVFANVMTMVPFTHQVTTIFLDLITATKLKARIDYWKYKHWFCRWLIRNSNYFTTVVKVVAGWKVPPNTYLSSETQ